MFLLSHKFQTSTTRFESGSEWVPPILLRNAIADIVQTEKDGDLFSVGGK